MRDTFTRTEMGEDGFVGQLRCRKCLTKYGKNSSRAQLNVKLFLYSQREKLGWGEKDWRRRKKLWNVSLFVFSNFKISEDFKIPVVWVLPNTEIKKLQFTGMQQSSILTFSTVGKVTTCICVVIMYYKLSSRSSIKTSVEHFRLCTSPLMVFTCVRLLRAWSPLCSECSGLVALNPNTQLYEIKPRDKQWKHTERENSSDSAGSRLACQKSNCAQLSKTD